MKKLITVTLTLVLLMAVCVAPVYAFEVSTKSNYTTGEPVVILVSDAAGLDPDEVTIKVTKPNGDEVTCDPGQQRWNGTTEVYDTYTIDMLGTYTVNASNTNGATASASFTSQLFTSASIIFTVISVLVLVVCYIFAKKQKGAKA